MHGHETDYKYCINLIFFFEKKKCKGVKSFLSGTVPGRYQNCGFTAICFTTVNGFPRPYKPILTDSRSGSIDNNLKKKKYKNDIRSGPPFRRSKHRVNNIFGNITGNYIEKYITVIINCTVKTHRTKHEYGDNNL